jgi:hypothetical protein
MVACSSIDLRREALRQLEPDDLGRYTSAISGETFDALADPPVHYLAAPDAPMQKIAMSEALASSLRAARYRPPGGSFVDVHVAADVPLWETDAGETVVDGPDIRRYLGYVKLDRRLYPSEPDEYLRTSRNALVQVRQVLAGGTLDDTDSLVWVRKDDTMQVIGMADGQPHVAVVHRADAHPSWVRVADFGGVRTMATTGVQVLTTDTNRKVVKGVQRSTMQDSH